MSACLPERPATSRLPDPSLLGKPQCIYWMFGTHDGMVISDAPDSISAAALSVTVGSTGAFKDLETHELLTQEQLGQALSRSKNAMPAYQPPGQQS
jgi:uncharacterized protein with GYD domain